jgi:plastocyanin
MRYAKSIAILACLAGGAMVVPAASGAGHKPKPVVKKVKVADNFYSPTKLTITRGSAVNWIWSAQNFESHNVTLIKGPKGVKHSKFTSIDGTTGLHFKRTFSTPGKYHFECTIHPSMNVAVTVKR